MALEDQMNAMASELPVDPVSGNEIPLGSTAEEVRDDIEANLSEGEYVVPADVLRFYGVKFFEDLRDHAKSEYAIMESEGRIGGEPVPAGMGGSEMSEEDLMASISDEDMNDMKAIMEGSASLPSEISAADLAEVKRIMEGSETITMAEGGLAATRKEGMPKASQMNVKEDVDGMIDRIFDIVERNPEIQRKLDAKGVKLAEGGYVRGYASGGTVVEPPAPPAIPSVLSGFETIGASSFSGMVTATGTTRPTELVDYYNPSTGATMKISVYSDTKQPVSPVPEGFRQGTPAVTAPRNDSDDDGPSDQPEVKRWYEDLKFGDPKSMSDWAKTQKGPPDMFRMSPVGAAANVSTVSTLRAAAILEKAKNGGKDNPTSKALMEQAQGIEDKYSPFEKIVASMFGNSGETQAKYASSQVGINLADPTKNVSDSSSRRMGFDPKGGGLEEAKKIKRDRALRAGGGKDPGPSAAEKAAARIRGDKEDKKQREKIISSGKTYTAKEAIAGQKDPKTRRGGRAEGGLMRKR